MTGRALAVILKLNFWKSCDHKKSIFIGPQPNNFMVHPIQAKLLIFAPVFHIVFLTMNLI
jgi:hypothetical protein